MNKQIEQMLRLATVLILVSLTAGCAGTAKGALLQSDKPRLTSDATDAETAELVAGNNAFAFDLYPRLRAEQDGNLFYSPYSISSALAMTYAGARGETEQQMAATMHYTLPQERLHPAFNALDTRLASYEDDEDEDAFQLNVANAIWGQEGYEFLPTFLDTLAENYGAGLRTLDFANETEAARQTINDWVSDQTEEKIQNLIRKGMLGSMVRLVLTNAIYFNGKWVSPFEKSNTHDEPFTLLDGSKVTVPMMSQVESLKYVEGNGYQAVELPYRDSNVSMLFILPEAGRFEEMEGVFSAEFVTAITESLTSQQVRLFAPKFTFESEFKLAETLIQMGMPAAFGNADFSGMTGNRDLFIGDVVHKAFVAVDEEGTEAAAATAVIMVEIARMIEDAILMRLDRPFLFLIRDNDTGTILFIGRVLNPEA
jgi:serpin B